MNKWNFGLLAHGLNNGRIFLLFAESKTKLKQTRNRTTTSKQLHKLCTQSRKHKGKKEKIKKHHPELLKVSL